MTTPDGADQHADQAKHPQSADPAVRRQREQDDHLFLRAIGTRIRRRREAMRITQIELAARAGMTRSRVWELESQKQPANFSVLVLNHIAHALECDPTELIKDPPD